MGNPRVGNPDHKRKVNMPAPENEVMAHTLSELLTPLIYKQFSHYKQLGLRERILGLPLMIAAVLTLLWRQVPSVRELCRLLNREDLLWCSSIKVSQQALSKRFLEFPASIFEQVMMELIPQLQARWLKRKNRPLSASIRFTKTKFERIWVVDGSTLEALFRHLKSLEDKTSLLAGKIYVLVDLLTHLPVAIAFKENPHYSDTKMWGWLQNCVSSNTLLIFDRGFYDFTEFAALVSQGAAWITRLKKASYRVQKTLSHTPSLVDQIIELGHKRGRAKPIVVRLVEVKCGKTWYKYITSVTCPSELPPYVVADLYNRRWRIETAFCLVKRLLGLAYIWTGSLNGIKLQIWATWLFYAVLLDVADNVADELAVETEQISIEMLFRSFYHFNHAYSQGLANDLIAYLISPQNQDLGIVKYQPKSRQRNVLDLSPYPNLTKAQSP